MRNSFYALSLLLITLCYTNVRATSIAFDNMPTDIFLTNSGGANYGPDMYFIGSPLTRQGMQFTSLVSGALTSVFAPIYSFPFFNSVPVNVEFSLWSDGGNIPLTQIETSSQLVEIATSATILEWTWQGTNFLDKGEKYWIVAQTDTPHAGISWQYVPWYLTTNAVRSNQTEGEDWQIYFGNGGESAMRVLVEPVPEPTTIFLFFAGLPILLSRCKATKRLQRRIQA
ncbi:MAG: PEP-CTERM sorting domain-containing protein [Proteobacteria bacterium]|nr:PEP-CTERM sorting domain-containing protein [Pseudomonadota bacterium]